jgi:type I restriction enzyme, S subunit
VTEHWEYVPLGDIAPARSLDMPAEEAIVWNLSLEDIEGSTGRVLRKQTCRVRDLGSTKCVFDTRHVLYSKLRPYLNKVVVPDSIGVGTSELIPLMPNWKLDREFLAYYLRSKEFVDFANANTRGANLPRIAMGELWAHRVPVPPSTTEQHRIVIRIKECMERIDEIEDLRDGARDDAQAVIPSVLNDVFKALNGSAPIQTIGNVTIETRYGTSQKCNSDPAGIPILRIPNVANGYINYDDLKYCDVTDEDVRRLQLADGDLLFVRTNGSRDLVGRCAVFQVSLDRRCIGFASYLIRVRLDPQKVVPRYLAYFLNSSKGRSEINTRRRTSAGQFNINSASLRSIPFPLPSLPEQERLVGLLEEREQRTLQLVRGLEAAAEAGKFGREAILRRAFEGKL